MTATLVLGAVIVAGIAVMAVTFLPRNAAPVDAHDPWAQRNDEALPSIKGRDGSTDLGDAIVMAHEEGLR